MWEAFRTAYQEIVGKLDELIDEVRLRNAQHAVVVAKLDVLIAIAEENRRREQDRTDKERMSIVMPMTDETM